MLHNLCYILYVAYFWDHSKSFNFDKKRTQQIEFSFIWVILFELGEVWWISKNGENGFESDDLWFQQLRLSCHFLTNWFELFWFIMLKDTRQPTYTSCPIWNPALSVYATNINHLIHENLNSIHENTTTDRKNFRNKKKLIF